MKNEYYLRPEGNRVFMCCGKQRCPSVQFNDEGLITIEDDYGNSVKMKKEEAALIKGAVQSLIDESKNKNE
jgi:hypothetical protein